MIVEAPHTGPISVSDSMSLLRAAAALCQQSPGSSLGGPLLHLLRQFATGPTNEAVERTIVVDTLAQVF